MGIVPRAIPIFLTGSFWMDLKLDSAVVPETYKINIQADVGIISVSMD